MKDKSREYHPLTIFLCFFSLLMLNILMMHPILSTLSLLISGILLFLYAKISVKSFICYMMIHLFITLSNPIFVSKGATILFYIRTLPYTLEALIYGAVFANMIISLLWWTQIFSTIITSDHIVYLFSNPFRSLGIMMAVVFRLIPKIKRRYQQIHLYYQKEKQGSLLKKTIDQFLILFTWAFESSIDMVDSMSARYYTNKRTHFHLFSWRPYDGMMVIIILLFDLILFNNYVAVYSRYYFYPLIKPISFSLVDLVTYSVYGVFLLCPYLFLKEERSYVSD